MDVLDGRLVLLAEEAEKPRRFRMVASTGAEFSRLYADRVRIDLAGIEAEFPLAILEDHSHRVGVARSGKLEQEGFVLEGELLDNEAARAIAADGRQGYPFQASIGADVLARETLAEGVSAEINGDTVTGPLELWRRVRLGESSVITLGNPADRGTSTAILAAEHEQRESDMAERKGLKEVLAALPPERHGWAAAQWADGKETLQIRAELADVLLAERAASDKAHAEALAEAKREQLDKLRLQAGSPGIGFDGRSREQDGGLTAEQLAALPAEERLAHAWASRPELRAEYGSTALLASYSAKHGVDAALALGGAA
jgi:hypothetical protein